jgi:predicted HTH domain antitoxin
VRIPAQLDNEISAVMEKEKLDKATVICNLLERGIAEWRKQTALELLGKRKVTFNEEAEVAKLSLWEFADLVKQHNVEWVRLSPFNEITHFLRRG